MIHKNNFLKLFFYAQKGHFLKILNFPQFSFIVLRALYGTMEEWNMEVWMELWKRAVKL